MTPLVCTEDPAQSAVREQDFRVLFGKAVGTERISPQHLRITLGTDEGLDISVLAREMQCCGWFDFRLTPTAAGTVVLDIAVPANTGRVRGPAPERHGAGSPEQILDTFAGLAAGTQAEAEEGEHDARGGLADECTCC